MEVWVFDNEYYSSGEWRPGYFSIQIGSGRRGQSIGPASYVKEWYLSVPLSVGNDSDDDLYPGEMFARAHGIGNWTVRFSKY